MSRQNPSPMRSDHVRTAARHWLGIVRQPPRRASAPPPVPPRARSGRASSVSCDACWTPPSKHTCSYGWAVVPTSTEHTSELDDSRSRRLTLGRRSLTHGRSRRHHVVAFGSFPSSSAVVSQVLVETPVRRAMRKCARRRQRPLSPRQEEHAGQPRPRPRPSRWRRTQLQLANDESFRTGLLVFCAGAGSGARAANSPASSSLFPPSRLPNRRAPARPIPSSTRSTTRTGRSTASPRSSA
jgi:hypothetical protein